MRILLTGPTAVGKTAVSLEIAERFNAEIISSDSRQCYKYLNIGTATPSSEELEKVSHHNISIIDPAEKDSAGKFYRRAMKWEDEIRNCGKTILYAGGSTLHQQCIIQPFDKMPSSDEANIEKLERQKKEEGIEALFKKLQEVDPEYAKKMDGMNPQRIIRALDVWMQTGKPFSSFHSNQPVSPSNDMLVFGLQRDRQNLYERINKRVERMFEAGFLKEVESILEMGYSKSDPGLNTVGYEQAINYLNGEMGRDQMIDEIKIKTRRYAKRQLTWFRKWDFVQWIDADGKSTKQIAENVMERG